MLQAQIDIVDEAGHIEESAIILGSGRVSLGTRPSGGYLHADEATPDLAVITQDEARVSLQVKAPNSLQLDGVYMIPGNVDLVLAENTMTAYFDKARRYLQVRRSVEVKLIVVSGELLNSGAVIHSAPSSFPSSLVRRAQASAARGAIEVTSRLQRLRDQGKIDEQGNILVPWPDDMKPDSSTDL